MQVSTVDWVLLVVLTVSVVIGAWRGLVYEVLSLLSWVVALVAAQWFAVDAGGHLPLGGASDTARYLAGFGAVFIGTLVVCMLVITLLKKFVSAVGLRPIDRALGALFGLVRGLVLLVVVVLLVSKSPLQRMADWQSSVGVKLLANTVKIVVPMLPSDIARYLPE